MPDQKRSDELLQALNKHNGNKSAAAKSLGLSRSTFRTLIKRAAQQGRLGTPPDPVAPGFEIKRASYWQTASGETRTSIKTAPEAGEVFTLPEGFELRAGTYQVGPDGRVERHWPRILPENHATALADRIEEVVSNLPVLKPVKRPKQKLSTALANLYTFTDAHIGMLAWHSEGGDDWDLKIAEAMLVGAFDHMIYSSPKADRAIVAWLGDTSHYDSMLPLTPASQNVLDADSRAGKMIDATIRIIYHVAARALETHSHVDLLIAEGNHDPYGSMILRKMFKKLFENEPRINVVDEEKPYYAVTHGSTFLGFHHGHLKGAGKASDLINLFSHEFADIWGGKDAKRYIHTGHKHFSNEDGSRGTIIRQHPTLAARDSYAARHGFLSIRGALCLTYHEKYGEVSSQRVCPEMLEDT